MLTPRENVMAILNGEKPDYIINIMDALKIQPDPEFIRAMIPRDGELHQDSWGVTKCCPPDAPGAHPGVTDENKICKDIEEWEKYVKAPSFDGLDWTQCIESAKQVDRAEYFCAIFMPTGLFERTHFLMGMEDAFINYLEYPDEMQALLRYICDWKLKQIDISFDKFQPDAVFYHDDWGSKINVFLPPDTWREMIKPLQTEIANAFHERGMLYIHHSDCFCEPITPDMLDIGIDCWQGVIPQNDILKIQNELTDHKLAMMGGIDVPKIDIEGLDEELIRAEVRRAYDEYCPGGKFFTGMPAGCCFIERNNQIANDEMNKYKYQWVQDHPECFQ